MVLGYPSNLALFFRSCGIWSLTTPIQWTPPNFRKIYFGFCSVLVLTVSCIYICGTCGNLIILYLLQACKGFFNIYATRMGLVPSNEIPHLLSTRNKPCTISKGTWVRMKNGNYKGDLGQVYDSIWAGNLLLFYFFLLFSNPLSTHCFLFKRLWIMMMHGSEQQSSWFLELIYKPSPKNMWV